MIGNVILFLKHVETKFLQESKLKKKGLSNSLLRAEKIIIGCPPRCCCPSAKGFAAENKYGNISNFFQSGHWWMNVCVNRLIRGLCKAYWGTVNVQPFFSYLKIKCMSSLPIYIVMYLNLWHTVPTEKQLSAVQEQAFMSAARQKNP